MSKKKKNQSNGIDVIIDDGGISRPEAPHPVETLIKEIDQTSRPKVRDHAGKAQKKLRKLALRELGGFDGMNLTAKLLWAIHTRAQIVCYDNPDAIVFQEKDVIDLLVSFGIPAPAYLEKKKKKKSV